MSLAVLNIFIPVSAMCFRMCVSAQGNAFIERFAIDRAFLRIALEKVSNEANLLGDLPVALRKNSSRSEKYSF